MKNLSCALIFMIVAGIASCKKCYNCQNICYSCNTPSHEPICSGENFLTARTVEDYVADLRSSGYECNKITPTLNDDFCITSKSKTEFEDFLNKSPQY